MMMRRLGLGLAVTVLLPLSAAAATITVTLTNFAFTPNDVTIGLHDTVHWTRSSGSHTVTSGASSSDVDAGSLFNSSINSSVPSFDYKFDTAGDYPYYCAPHESTGMTGVIRVAAQADVQKTAWSRIKRLYR